MHAKAISSARPTRLSHGPSSLLLEFTAVGFSDDTAKVGANDGVRGNGRVGKKAEPPPFSLSCTELERGVVAAGQAAVGASGQLHVVGEPSTEKTD